VQYISTARIDRLSKRCAFNWQWWLYHFSQGRQPLSQCTPTEESPLSGYFLSFLTSATTITRPRPSDPDCGLTHLYFNRPLPPAVLFNSHSIISPEIN
jgi:hypothetical protein